MNPDDWKRYGEASAARNALDLLADHFDSTQGRLDNDLFHKLDQGVALTPEEALQFIYMKHANYLLMKKLASHLRTGAAAGARLAPHLNGAPDA